MIAHLDDFCPWVYVVVDDMCKELEGHLRRPGAEPEVATVNTARIVSSVNVWDLETELLSHMQAHRDKFPIILERSRFNRQRRNLMWIINEMRRMMLARMEIYRDAHCVIDSLPIPVVQFRLAPQSRPKWSD